MAPVINLVGAINISSLVKTEPVKKPITIEAMPTETSGTE